MLIYILLFLSGLLGSKIIKRSSIKLLHTDTINNFNYKLQIYIKINNIQKKIFNNNNNKSS